MNTERVTAFLKVWESLSWSRVTLGSAFGLMCLVLLYVYKNLDTAVPAILSNNLALFGLVLALLLGVVGTVGGRMLHTLQTKVEEQQNEIHAYLRTELEAVRMAHRDALASEAVLKSQIDLLQRRLTRAENALRAAGLDTDFGDL